MKIAQTFFLSLLLLAIALPTHAQEAPVVTETAPPKEGVKFFFNGPAPVFGQLRTPRPKRNIGQFQLGAKGTLAPSSPLGKVVLESDNIISTDAFDIGTRLGLKISAERNDVLSGLAFATNQQNSSPTLSASIGSRLPFWTDKTRVGGFGIQEAGGLDVTFFRLENRLKVDPKISPNHIGKSVFTPSIGLRLPTMFFGKKATDMTTSNTAHLMFKSNAWFFLDEKAAPGYKVHPFESQVLAQIVFPKAALPFKLPLVQGFTINFARGANPASGYAPLNQFQFNLQLFDFAPKLPTAPKPPAMPKVPAVPKMPAI
jgi:hypothetical protein